MQDQPQVEPWMLEEDVLKTLATEEGMRVVPNSLNRAIELFSAYAKNRLEHRPDIPEELGVALGLPGTDPLIVQRNEYVVSQRALEADALATELPLRDSIEALQSALGMAKEVLRQAEKAREEGRLLSAAAPAESRGGPAPMLSRTKGNASGSRTRSSSSASSRPSASPAVAQQRV
jgi:hypothetical protein